MLSEGLCRPDVHVLSKVYILMSNSAIWKWSRMFFDSRASSVACARMWWCSVDGESRVVLVLTALFRELEEYITWRFVSSGDVRKHAIQLPRCNERE